MFDAMKFTGDKIHTEDIMVNTECAEIIGVYLVVTRHDEDGSLYYEVSDEPDGKLMVYKAHDGATSSIYIRNDVETSCLVDLL